MKKTIIGLLLINIGISIINLLKTKEMADKFEPLQQEVEETGNVVDSAVALIGGIADQLEEAKDDPEQIEALVTELRQKREALAAAIQANTPAPAPAPTPEEGGGTL